MKKVLFVPGYQEDTDSRDYASTICAIKARGYEVEFVPISWKRTTIDQWVDQLEDVYNKCDPRQTILAGFSFGAMTAFVTATKRNPCELWLFSLSPYFVEDINSPDMKKSWLSQIGHRRVTAFSNLNFKKLSSQIGCRVLLFLGEVEMNKWPDMKQRSNDAHTLLHGSVLTIVTGVGHDVAHPDYIEAIKRAI